MANMSRKEHFHKALSDMSMEGFLQLVDQIWNAAFTATETLGSFTSVLPNDGFLGRLHLIAIDKLHLCAKDNWSGNFRPGRCHIYQSMQVSSTGNQHSSRESWLILEKSRTSYK